MYKVQKLYIILFIVLFWSCAKRDAEGLVLHNTKNNLNVEIGLDEAQQPFYKVFHGKKLIIDTSYLGLLRADAQFYKNMRIVKASEPKSIEDSYSLFHGKQKDINYQAQQYTISLENEDGLPMDMVFNLSDDGIAFRYVFPDTSDSIKTIIDEKTTYNFVENTKGWLQPMSKAKTGWQQTNPSYEEHYLMDIPVSEPSPIGEGWVYPALFKTDSTWIAVTETALDRNYCGTRLQFSEVHKALGVTFPQKEEIFPGGELQPNATLPWKTPWRILAIGDLKTLTESTLGTDLAEEAIEMDTSFIKSGLASWSWVLLKDDFTNFETSLRFIDYASEMKWQYCLIDADWDQKIGYDKMRQLVNYANSKNVRVLVWYNSAGSWNTTPYTPKSKLLTHQGRTQEFNKLNDIGVAGVKIDFFGGDGQSMIAYYHDILQDAAEHKLLVNFHGATLPRGWHRTYPNLMTVEAIKGEEFITFEQENADLQPNHSAMLPFTRNLFDPMDFTPMVLDSIPGINRKTTKAFELALPVLFLSGIQHMAETPSGMKKQPDFVIDYLKDIPTNWDESRFIDGYPGKYVVLARRKGNTWHVVGINGENSPRSLDLDLSFIEAKDGFMIQLENSKFKKNSINSSNLKSIELGIHDGIVAKF
jgi:hypothetical protein